MPTSPNLLASNPGDMALVRGVLAYSRLAGPLHGQTLRDYGKTSRFPPTSPCYVIDIADAQVVPADPAGNLTPFEAYMTEKLYTGKDGRTHLREEPCQAKVDYEVDPYENPRVNNVVYPAAPIFRPRADGTGYEPFDLESDLAVDLPVMLVMICSRSKMSGSLYRRPHQIFLPEGPRYYGQNNDALAAWGITLAPGASPAAPSATAAPQTEATPAPEPQRSPFFSPAPAPAGPALADHDIEFGPSVEPEVTAPAQAATVPFPAPAPDPAPVVDLQQAMAEYGVLCGKVASRQPLTAEETSRMVELGALIQAAASPAPTVVEAPPTQAAPAEVPPMYAAVGAGGGIVY